MHWFPCLFHDFFQGYSPQEKAFHQKLLAVDFVVICLGPFALTALFKALSPNLDAAAYSNVRPQVVLVASVLSAVLAVFVLYEHALVCPFPMEDTVDIWGVTQKIGRWIYLTRQVLAIQAFHVVASCLADFDLWPAMRVPTHSASVLVAGLGIFVTIQFFALVYNDPTFLDECQKWAKRGIPFRFLHAWVHIPCGFLAIVDILVIKDRLLLRAATSPLTDLVGYFCVYVLCYMALVHGNHYVTGFWPYGVMRDLGETWGTAWTGFCLLQTAILTVFLTVAWLIMRSVPPLW